jgi:hypothetical protein
MDLRGEPTKDIKDKQLFHRVDALRYGCTLIKLDAQPQFRTPKTEGAFVKRSPVKLPFGNSKIPRID